MVPSTRPGLPPLRTGFLANKGRGLKDFLTPGREDQQGRGQLGLALALLGKAINPQGSLNDIAIGLSQGNIAEAGERADRDEFMTELERLIAAREGRLPGGGGGLPFNPNPLQPVNPALPVTPLGGGSFLGDPRAQAGPASFSGGGAPGFQGGGFNGGGELERLLASQGRGAPTTNFPDSGRSSSAGGRFSGLFPEQIGAIFGRENQRRANLRALDQRSVEGEARVEAATTLFGRQQLLETQRQHGRFNLQIAKDLAEQFDVGLPFIKRIGEITNQFNTEFIVGTAKDRIEALADLVDSEDGRKPGGKEILVRRAQEIVADSFGEISLEEASSIMGISLEEEVATPTAEPEDTPSAPPDGQVTRDASGNLVFETPTVEPSVVTAAPAVEQLPIAPTGPAEESLLSRFIAGATGTTPGTARETIGDTVNSVVSEIGGVAADVKAKLSAELQNHREDREFQREKFREEQRKEARQDALSKAKDAHDAQTSAIKGGARVRNIMSYDEDLKAQAFDSRNKARAGQITVEEHVSNLVALTQMQLSRDLLQAGSAFQ